MYPKVVATAVALPRCEYAESIRGSGAATGVLPETRRGTCQRVYQELDTASPSRFDSLVNIGIDEIS